MLRVILLIFTFTVINTYTYTQSPEDEILKTIIVEEFTIKLIRSRAVENVGILPLDKPERYATHYFVFAKDSNIAICPYIDGECKIYFNERKKIKGFYYVSHAITVDICNLELSKEPPPDLSWLKGSIDSITIFPLDSVLDPHNYQGQKVVISNYETRTPEKLNQQNTASILMNIQNARPTGFFQPSMQRIQHYELKIYTNLEVYTIYLYYDYFFYKNWAFTIGYSMYGSENVAKKFWESHEKSKQSAENK